MMAEVSPRELIRQASPRRELAHELRNALSPIASSVNLLRLSNFDPNIGCATAETIDRGLRHALAAIDAFVQAEAGEPVATAAPGGAAQDRRGESARGSD